MENVAVDSPVPVQGKEPSPIVAINLNGPAGHVIFENGTPLEIEETSALARLRAYKCGKELELHSSCASQGFMKTFEDGKSIWDYLLVDTSTIHFHGKWDSSLSAFIVSKAPMFKAVSYTYWDCDEPAKVVNAISSRGINELSMHVKCGKQTSVVEALGRLGDRFGPTIERLILVFEVPFRGDPMPWFREDLEKALVLDAEVILLFGGEEQCIKSLVKDGYRFIGHIQMATNKLYEDKSRKLYEIYEVYQKNWFGARWRIGSRHGKYPPNETPPSLSLRQSCIPHVQDIRVRPADRALQWDAVNSGFLQEDEHNLVKGNYTYDPLERLFPDKTCCELEVPFVAWMILGKKIRKLIYNGHSTEILTSNGFYIVLDKMEDEANFFATMKTTPRFVFMCITSHRLCIVTANMKKFLAEAYHIEFVGTWYSLVIEEIARHFTTRLYALTMMQIELHTTRPLIHIFNAMSDDVKRNLRVFHFDARATNDWSVGSVVNAIMKQKKKSINLKMKFNELIIISNKWQCQQGLLFLKCRLDYHVRDCAHRLLEPNGSATTVVIEDKTSEEYHEAGFHDPSFPVMAPVAYPRRDTADGLTRLMDGYYQECAGRHIHIVVPGRPLL